jgi:RNA polymerase sigma-70 factor (ECF subfamily)
MPNSSSPNVEVLLSQALAGSRDGFGRLLHVYRNYLKLLVVTQLERKLQQRVSPSDVVQETFLEANRDFAQFRGTSSREFCAWLRQILVNNLHRVVEKHVLAAKRDVRREVSLERLASNLEQSTARLEAMLPDPGTSPSGNAQRHEMEVVLADHLAALPADYRAAIVLRHIEGLPFEAIGERLDRSAGAARMLWLRAIQVLRERMHD